MLALPLALAGCGAADYLNHRDTVSLRTGDATAFNAAVQTVDPQANRADNTHIHTDGKYVSNVMDDYHSRPKPEASAQPSVNFNVQQAQQAQQ